MGNGNGIRVLHPEDQISTRITERTRSTISKNNFKTESQQQLQSQQQQAGSHQKVRPHDEQAVLQGAGRTDWLQEVEMNNTM